MSSSPTRSSRSCHDSANPCLAWARSPTMVRLRDGQRQQQHLPLRVGQLLGLVHHDVGERAGEEIRVGARQGTLVDQLRRAGRRRAASTSRACRSRRWRSGGRRPGTSAPARRRARHRAGAGVRDASGSPSRCRAASRSGRSETVQACGSRRWSLRTSSGVEPGRAHAQVRRHRPQVADEVGRLQQRPRHAEGGRPAPRSAPSHG